MRGCLEQKCKYPSKHIPLDELLETAGLRERFQWPTKDQWVGDVGVPGGRQLVESLSANIEERLRDVGETDRLRTTAGWIVDFVKATGRKMWADSPSLPGYKAYNQRSLELLAMFMRQTGSKQQGGRFGTPLLSRSVEGVVSTAKAQRERVERAFITPANGGAALSAVCTPRLLPAPWWRVPSRRLETAQDNLSGFP